MIERLDKLIDLARRGRPAGDAGVPYGFATRVAAQAFEPREAGLIAIFEKMGKWAVAFAFTACVLTAVLHHRSHPASSALAEFAASNLAGERLW